MRGVLWLLTLAAQGIFLAGTASAQTTVYHLHNELSTTPDTRQLKTANPDNAAVTLQTADLKNSTPFIEPRWTFDTQAGIPGAVGTVPAGSTVNFAIWMRKTANWGTFYPRLWLWRNTNNGSNPIFCYAAAESQTPPLPAPALTTTITKYNLSCATSTAVAMTSADRWFLAVGVNMSVGPGNHSVKVEIRIEGTPNGNYDSTVTTPAIVPPPPHINSLTPFSGQVGTVVTVSGSYFGASQGASVIKFNGMTATPSAWSNTSITAPVPAAATTGPVVVTVGGVASNSLTFSVFTVGSLTGTVTRATGGTAIIGALVEALQSGVVRGSATTGSGGSYSIPNLTSGTYDIRTSAATYLTKIATNVALSGTSTTHNVSLVVPATISGQVTAVSGGAPVSGAGIAVSISGSVVSTATANGTGNYTVANLQPGTYAVEASAVGFQPSTQSGVVVAEGAAVVANISLNAAGSGAIRYLYDEVGRLKAVIDLAGETATYTYDAVGNVLSIARHSSSSVSVLEFSPDIGPVGTLVTIFGTGFSSVASENVVKFNGVTANVASSTSTQISATVPAGASTGPIQVTSPSGTATSASAFTVGSSGAPTVTGFNPTLADPGTAVTVTGTNFSPVPANNAVKFNITAASVSSSTSTSLATSIPVRARTGRVSVATSSGIGVSTGYLFVPLAPHVASEIGTTMALSLGTPTSVPITIANKIAWMGFDGVANRRVSVQMQAGTWVGCSTLRLKLYDTANNPIPFGNQYVNPYEEIAAGPIFLDARILPFTGTYSLVLVPCTNSTGSTTLTVFDVPPDLAGTTVPDGPPVTAVTTVPGQNAQYTFQATAGQRVSLNYSPVSGGQSCAWVTATVDQYYSASCGGFAEPVALPSAGTYRVFIDPTGATTGSSTFTLYDVPPDVTASLTVNGPSVPIPITKPGQNGSATFAGTQGQQVTVRVTGNTMNTSGCVTVKLMNGMTQLTSMTSCAASFNLPAQTLPANATYTVVIDPVDANTGSLNVNVTNP